MTIDTAHIRERLGGGVTGHTVVGLCDEIDRLRGLLEQQPRAVPEGWSVTRSGAVIVVQKPERGGYVARHDDTNIASSILYAFVDDLLNAAPPPPAQAHCGYTKAENCNDAGCFHLEAGEGEQQPAQAERQYFYRVDECKAIDSKSDLCICWHDQGTGPFPDAKPGDETPSNWRAKPVAVSDAPCDKCGYNGPGYYQPDTHPCVAQAAGGVGLALQRIVDEADQHPFNPIGHVIAHVVPEARALLAQPQPEVGS